MSAKTITRLISRVKRGFNIYLLSLIIRFSRHAMWPVQHTVAVIWIPVGVVKEFRNNMRRSGFYPRRCWRIHRGKVRMLWELVSGLDSLPCLDLHCERDLTPTVNERTNRFANSIYPMCKNFFAQIGSTPTVDSKTIVPIQNGTSRPDRG